MLDLRRAALRRLLAAERPDGGGAGEIGSEGEEGDAHQNHETVVKLKVLARRQGAHGCRRNSSPEMLWFSGAVRRCQGEATGLAEARQRVC